MRAWRYIAIVALGVAGSVLALGLGDDRGVWAYRKHVIVVQSHLSDLKTHLLNYRRVHGRFPSNDEGLAALDNFPARFSLPYPGPQNDIFRWPYFFWESSQRNLKEYHQRSGHVPRTAREWNDVSRIYCVEDTPSLFPQTTYVVTDGDNLMPVSTTAIFTPWMVPYLYENRQGLSEEKFRDSPVAADRWGHYSIKVDDGIYVYSIGGQIYSQGLHDAWWNHHGPRMVGVGIVSAALILLLVMVARRKMGVIAGIVAFIGSVGAGAGATVLGQATCYEASAAFSGMRQPAMIDRQRELLAMYRKNGVLGEAAYRTAVEALENGPATTRPASAATQPRE
ncbi:MAG: hypothetical protein ABFD92_14225 [Planctomycetaceae bacterium]|nr:hypothetical protein [Planctomycetaceae bacterium]